MTWQVKEWNNGILIIDDITKRLSCQQMISFTEQGDVSFAKAIVEELYQWVVKMEEESE